MGSVSKCNQMSPLLKIWAFWLPIGIHGCVNPIIEPKPDFTVILEWLNDMESRAVDYSSSNPPQKYEIVFAKSEYRVTHAWWGCENIGYTIGDFMPDTLASIQASWPGDNKRFWTTINDFDDEGTFVYSNGEVAEVTVVGNTADKDFVIYDIDTDTYTAADYLADTAYYFCTRNPLPSWSDWSNWSACSASCGPGTRSRSQIVLKRTLKCWFPARERPLMLSTSAWTKVMDNTERLSRNLKTVSCEFAVSIGAIILFYIYHRTCHEYKNIYSDII